jgi:hypothetical protein
LSSSKGYSFYVQLPTDTADGDISVCTYEGKYATFFWHKNEPFMEAVNRFYDWLGATEKRLGCHIDEWMRGLDAVSLATKGA